MASTERSVSQDDIFVLTRASPGPAQKLLAVAVVLVILAAAVGIAWPLAGVQLRPVEAFVPFYLTAMFLTDLITAVLLFAQFSILRTRALLIAANGYVFTALIMIPYALTFPGVFEPGRGLIGGLQSSAWFYVVWHCGFALFVLGFALLKDLDVSTPYWPARAREPIVVSLALTIAVASAAVFICIVGEALLPTIMLDRFHFAVLRWRSHRVVMYLRPDRALDPATHGTRSLADGGDGPLPGRGAAQLLSLSVSLQRRLVCRQSHWGHIQQSRPHRPVV
jgi:hypothetical protein